MTDKTTTTVSEDAPTDVRRIDLDAKRAARAAARKDNTDPVTIILGGITYTLPEELPADFVDLIAEGRFREGFEVLMGDDFDAFWANGLTLEDLREFADEIAPAYGLGGGSGNSGGSGRSSRRTTRR